MADHLSSRNETGLNLDAHHFANELCRLKVPLTDFDQLKLAAPVLGAVERLRGGRRRFWVYCPHCKVGHVHGPAEGSGRLAKNR